MRNLSLLLFVCLTLTSCLEVKFKGKIDRSGAGEMTIISEVPARNVLNQDDPLPTPQQLHAEEAATLEVEMKKAEISGVEVTDCSVELVDEVKVQRMTLKFDHLGELNAYLNLETKSKTEVSVTTKGNSSTLNHRIYAPEKEEMDAQQQAMMNAVLDKARVTILWSLPAEAGVISEGGVVSDDGQTVQWEYPLKTWVDEGIHVFASFDGAIQQATVKDDSIPNVVGEASEPEEVGISSMLYNAMLFLSIFGAVVIAFLVFLKIRVSRMEKK